MQKLEQTSGRSPKKGLRLLTETLLPLVNGGGNGNGGSGDPTQTTNG